MGTTKKLSGKAMGYVILIGLVILSWAIFKILTPHNFGSFSNMLNYFQASLIATVGAVGFYFVMVMGMFDFSIGANIMLSAIVGCVLATKFNLGYFGLIVGCILTGAIVGILNGIFYVKLRIPSMIVTTGLALIYESLANYIGRWCGTDTSGTLKSIRTDALGYYSCISGLRSSLHILKLH